MPHFQISVVFTLHCIVTVLKLPCDLIAATFRFNDMCRDTGRDLHCIVFSFLLNTSTGKSCTLIDGCFRRTQHRRLTLTCLASAAPSLVWFTRSLPTASASALKTSRQRGCPNKAVTRSSSHHATLTRSTTWNARKAKVRM